MMALTFHSGLCRRHTSSQNHMFEVVPRLHRLSYSRWQRLTATRTPAAGANGVQVRSSAPQGDETGQGEHQAASSSAGRELQRSTVAEDPWVAKTLSSFATAHLPYTSVWLQQMRQTNLNALQTQRMPTTRNEAYRFTDVTPILKTTFQSATDSSSVTSATVARQALHEADGLRIVVVDGKLVPHLSDTSALPQGVYLGEAADAPDHVASTLDQQARKRGGPFALVNGATAREVLCLAVPAGLSVDVPVHILHISTGDLADAILSSPRTLISLGAKASVAIVEEFTADSSTSHYFSNSVTEIDLAEGAHLTHRYVQLETPGAWHMKATLVRQGARSAYELVEASLGASIARHDINVEQAGEGTSTVMRSFLLCGDHQLRDLHSRLILQHPEGFASQLHKCIVAAPTGRGVFDGNVRVNRLAQRTDAGQLSRNLLLVPRATVNVKPNLQIVADDVKCSHGCTVSDLEEEQLFYFRARGIDDQMARRILVYSFGSEVTEGFHFKQLLDRIEARVANTLAPTVNTITMDAESVRTR